MVTITAVSNNNLVLENIQFQILTDQNNLEYFLNIYDADPPMYKKDLSDVYALTLDSTVIDNSTGLPVTSNSDFNNYEGCYIAFIDGNGDQSYYRQLGL